MNVARVLAGWAPGDTEGPRLPLVNAILVRGGLGFACAYGAQDRPALFAPVRNCVANAPANWAGDAPTPRCMAAPGVDCSARCTN